MLLSITDSSAHTVLISYRSVPWSSSIFYWYSEHRYLVYTLRVSPAYCLSFIILLNPLGLNSICVRPHSSSTMSVIGFVWSCSGTRDHWGDSCQSLTLYCICSNSPVRHLGIYTSWQEDDVYSCINPSAVPTHKASPDYKMLGFHSENGVLMFVVSIQWRIVTVMILQSSLRWT